MGGPVLKPIPFKSVPALFLRLLPTMFEYARLTAVEGSKVSPAARQLYIAHLRTLKAYLVTAARASGLAPGTVEPLVDRCDAMAQLRGAELSRTFAALLKGMQAIYAANRETIRDAITADPELYRELYRIEVTPKKILAIYMKDTWARSERLGNTLSNRCWYDYRRHCENTGMMWIEGSDVVLFAPGQRPLPASIEDRVASAEIPVLVLAGWSRKDDPDGMAELRTEFHYRRSGYRVLHGPFTPTRLYQAIDSLHLQNLARRHEPFQSMVAAAS